MHKRRIGLMSAFLIVFILISSYFIINNILPESISIIENNESTLNLTLPFDLYMKANNNNGLMINGREIGRESFRVDTASPLTVKGDKIGESQINLKLFGFIPLKTIKVSVIPEINVIPGGQAIGVILRSKGVMVVEQTYVEDKYGERHYPARDAGIEVGDTILQINGKTANKKSNISNIIQESAGNGEVITFLVKKSSENIEEIKVKPVRNHNGDYMIGLYVDDGVAGVGTLTFYQPDNNIFGALGHVITEGNSNIKIDVRKGEIVEAKISGINYGRRGLPGEKRGTFFNARNILGSINTNTRFGIYGRLNRVPQNQYFDKPIPVAAISQVHKGPAKIYTVVKGGKIDQFQINIDRVFHQTTPEPKSMIISITDPELKKLTGGIIQGMSGSPIVQDNKLVGAVTHVFIKNPARGYGVFAEWMLRESSILENMNN